MFKQQFDKVTDDLVSKGGKSDATKVNTEYIEDALYYIFTEKTEGVAAVKVKAFEPGEGLRAYHSVFTWFVRTSGQALGERSRRAGHPETIASEKTMYEKI